jgi:uncharacterized protein YggE
MKGRLLIGIGAVLVGVVVILVGLSAAGLVAFLSPAQAMPLRAASLVSADPSVANGSTIVVVGTGTVKAKPDVAYINVGVQAHGATAQDAQNEASRLMAAVVAKLKALGIADKDIQTSGINVYPVTDQSPDKITGYTATNTITVTVNEIDRAGEILDGAIGAGANTAGGISFGIKDPAPLQRQALGEAVKDARPKGDAIAQAMGVQITGIKSVTEDAAAGPIPYPKLALPAAQGMGSTPVAPGELTITAQVTVVYTY